MLTESDREADDRGLEIMLFQEEEDDEKRSTALHADAATELVKQNYLRSVNSTVVIRQLPSQGLSFQLWPAAATLVTLLDEYRRDPNCSPLSGTFSALIDGRNGPLKVLELGSGTGLVGIAAAITLGAVVTLTDLVNVLPNIQFNADANAEVLALNGGSLRVSPLKWGDSDDAEKIGRDFDLILASDVVYYDSLYEPLIETLRSLMLGGGNSKMVFIMAHLRRWKKDSSFFKKAKKLFEVSVIHVDRPREGSRIGVVVYSFAPKRRSSLESGHGSSVTNC